jgi:hypothetical protein
VRVHDRWSTVNTSREARLAFPAQLNCCGKGKAGRAAEGGMISYLVCCEEVVSPGVVPDVNFLHAHCALALCMLVVLVHNAPVVG